jgi:hypothetical protein
VRCEVGDRGEDVRTVIKGVVPSTSSMELPKKPLNLKNFGSMDGSNIPEGGAAVPDGGAGSATEVDFVASAAFEGAKPGFRFSTGAEGTGYYREGYVGTTVITLFVQGLPSCCAMVLTPTNNSPATGVRTTMTAPGWM